MIPSKWSSNSVTLTNSTILSNSAVFYGGGLYTMLDLYMTNSTIKSNSTEANGSGGGLFVQTNGNVYLLNNKFYENTAGYGGGIYVDNNGSATVSNTLIYSNSATILGGGLFNKGTLNLYQSAIFANTATRSAGILNMGNADVVNSTVSSNTALNTNLEGGINVAGSMNLTNTTIVSNTGYGIVQESGGNLNIKNSVVAYNNGGNCAIGATPITSLGYNISSDNSCDFFFTQPGDLVNTDPLLGALQFINGTYLHPLLMNSPALEAGTCEVALDQAGQARPAPMATHCDIGAVESPLAPALADLAISKTVNPLVAVPGQIITYTLTFSNQGSVMANNLTLGDNFPPEVTLLSVAISGTSLTQNAMGNHYQWQAATMPVGAVGQIIVTAQISPTFSSGIIANTADIAAAQLDSNFADNSSTAVVNVVMPKADLALIKSVTPLMAAPGETVTYTIELSNNGPDTATGIQLTDIVPLELINLDWQANVTLTPRRVAVWQSGDHQPTP